MTPKRGTLTVPKPLDKTFVLQKKNAAPDEADRKSTSGNQVLLLVHAMSLPCQIRSF